jgi:hypothetical protein
MNVRLFSITTVLLFLLGAATTRLSAANPQNVDKKATGEKSDAGEEPSHAKDETPEPPSAAQKEFADSLVAALNSKDTSRLKALIAPQSLACFDKSRQPYLDGWLRRQFRFPIGKDHQVSVAKLPPDFSAKATRVKFPVAPTHALIISYDGAGALRTYRRLIAEQDNRWRLILGCPTDATMVNFNKSEQIKARVAERADKLIPKVKEPLTSQIRAMVAKGDRMGASKLCAEELHTDLLTAREVVSRVSGEENH